MFERVRRILTAPYDDGTVDRPSYSAITLTEDVTGFKDGSFRQFIRVDRKRLKSLRLRRKRSDVVKMSLRTEKCP